jgi:signal transduction histidine kinase
MRLRTGLRVRIAVTIAGIVLVAVAGLAVAMHQIVVTSRVSQARSAADEQMHAALAIYSSTRLLSFDARVDDPSVPRELATELTRNGDRGTLVRGGRVREVWAAGRVDGRMLSTRTRITAVNGTVREIDRALLATGLATVAVATLLGLLSANQLARRLRRAARTAREVAAGEDPASLRSVVGARRDEVGDLADAVDTMTERLAERLSAEQRFTADVAHDLRTPVTGLLTAAALLDDSRPAQLVRDRAEALATLVEELLEVARLDRGQETAELEHVSLADVVDRTVRRGTASGELADAELLVRRNPDAGTVATDPRRVERVLTNLLRNAVGHGEPPVEVTQHQHSISVRDHGSGFDASMLSEGPQPFRRQRFHADGNGLGLVIAAGHAAVLGGTLELANAEDGGARVTLRLPARAEGNLTTGSQQPRETGTQP